MTEGLRLEQRETVATLWIDRQAKMNTITVAMRNELPRIFRELDATDTVRVVVVRGAGGKAFSAGGDVSEFLALAPADLEAWGDTVSAPERCRKPVIAAIDGYAIPGVVAVLTGADVAAHTRPFPVGVTAPVRYFGAATDKVRFVGEPVAVVVARDRYAAEDAAERVVVEYELLPAVVDPERALRDDAPVLHEAVGSNLACHRRLVYGDPDRAFAGADVVVRERFRYPKYASTPIETYGVVARWDPFEGVLTVWSNFTGPFAMHSLVARALQLPTR